jgi:membrane-bound lytic murein transglycosylase MltF
MTRKLLLFCLVLSCLLWPSLSQATGKYDLHFKRWGEFYFPFHDWKLWKAQGLAESKLNPSAISWCGAIGVMQLMPGTAKDMKVDPYDIEANIQGGIKYNRQMYRIWKVISDDSERLNFTWASYNAGPGHIIKARKIAKSDKWQDVSTALPQVTGKYAKETQTYIKHIKIYYRQIQ